MRNFSQSRAMIDAIGGIRALLKWESLRPDNFVFRLHYKVTFAFLLVCSFIVTAKQYVGDPIDCVTSAAVEKLIDQYCWIHSTFTITRLDKFGRHTYHFSPDDQVNPNSHLYSLSSPLGSKSSGSSSSSHQHHRGQPEGSAALRAAGTGGILPPPNTYTYIYNPNLHGGYPGVHAIQSVHEFKLYHRYYQWVCFVLLFQSLLFYLPCYIWKIFDGGQLKVLVAGLQFHSFNTHITNMRKEQILSYFITYKGHWNCYMAKFYFCELLNLVNILTQLYFMDKFFGNLFSSFGFSLFNLTDEDPYKRTDNLAIMFPKVTKCTFNAHGIGGDIISHDAICVLSVNNINEKIYIFLWFWFFILLVLTCLQLIYRIFTLLSWKIRYFLLHIQCGSPQIKPQLRSLIFLLSSSDWFILYEFSKNIHTQLFIAIVTEMYERIRKNKFKVGNSVTAV